MENICTDSGAWLRLIFQGLIALGALVAIWRWRKNEKWKLDFQLADKTLVDFHRMQAIIAEIRHPFSPAGEAPPRERDENESPEESTARDTAHTTIERIRRNRDFISDFRARRFEVFVRFGEETASLFDEMNKALNQICGGADMYVRASAILEFPEYSPTRKQRNDAALKNRQKAKELIFSLDDENDKIKREVEEIVKKAKKALEQYLRP